MTHGLAGNPFDVAGQRFIRGLQWKRFRDGGEELGHGCQDVGVDVQVVCVSCCSEEARQRRQRVGKRRLADHLRWILWQRATGIVVRSYEVDHDVGAGSNSAQREGRGIGVLPENEVEDADGDEEGSEFGKLVAAGQKYGALSGRAFCPAQCVQDLRCHSDRSQVVVGDDQQILVVQDLAQGFRAAWAGVQEEAGERTAWCGGPHRRGRFSEVAGAQGYSNGVDPGDVSQPMHAVLEWLSCFVVVVVADHGDCARERGAGRVSRRIGHELLREEKGVCGCSPAV
ncbi:hypothetical protein C1N81_05530 (plasmid) [Streptomyces sp. SGAir0957]